MFDWRALVAIGFGGGLGSVLRYLVTFAFTQRFGAGFPWGTLAINITGSLVIGVVFELSQTRVIGISPIVRLFLMTGILGGYTTFSTFSLDLVMLGGERALAPAFLYLMASVAGGFLVAYLGIVLIRALATNAM